MAQQTKKLITVEDHYVEGGLGEAVAREAAGLAEVLAIGIIQLPHSGLSKELLQAHGLDHTSIEKYVKSLLDSPL
jgi:transketolase